MQIGAIYPQIHMGTDPAVIRDFAQTAEGLGFSHILTFEHVIGADPNRPGGWSGSYDISSSFIEPFLLYTYMAAATTRIGFITGVLILPQRQTVLVAKQAATLDVLSEGRLRLGVGLGWNAVEYEALNEKFTNRGRRMDEQIEVLRILWTQENVDYTGRWHRIDRAGIWPLPPQRPIPIWVGGMSDFALQRAARIGDGWVSSAATMPVATEMIERLRGYVAAAGRSVGDFGVEMRIPYGDGNPDTWQVAVDAFRALNVDYVCIDPASGTKFANPRDYIAAIKRFKESVS